MMDKRKILATLMALGLVVTTFAFLATPVTAANPQNWHFIDTTSWADLRVRDTTADATNPNGGVVRWLIDDTPLEVNTDVTTDPGTPYGGMSAWIGATGRAGADYYVVVNTGGAQTEPTSGEPATFFWELDANIAASPRVYNPTSAASPLTGGTIPNGYIWAGADNIDSTITDQEPLMSGSPPTTFFEAVKMPLPTESGGDFSWAGVTEPADIAGGVGTTNAKITNWHLWESTASSGPWTEVGTAAFGSPITYGGTAGNWYSSSVTWFGGVVGMVLSEPMQFAAAASPVTTISGITTANDPTPDFTYTTDAGAPTSVNFYYTNNAGATWTPYGSDTSVDGLFTGTTLLDGTYYFNTSADDGTANEGVPVDGVLGAHSEWGPYVIDTAAPTLSTTPVDGDSGVAVSANIVVQYSEQMDNAVTPTLTQTAGVDNGGWTFVGWSTTTFTDDTATWSHTDWNALDTITMQVSGGQDLAGNAGPTYSWSFTTSDPNPPLAYIDEASISPDPYIGTIPDNSDWTVYVDDTGLGDQVPNAAQISFDGGATWNDMTFVSNVGANATFTYNWEMHNETIVNKNVVVQGSDSGGATWGAQDTYTYLFSDTTAPTYNFIAPTPADGGAIPLSDVTIQLEVSDFQDVFTLGSCVISAQNLSGQLFTDQPMNFVSWAFGSNIDTFSYPILQTEEGDTITYWVNATDGTTPQSVQRSFSYNAGSEPTNQLNVGGRVYLYDGTVGGGYLPLAVQGASVTAATYNITGAVTTLGPQITDAAGNYYFTFQPSEYTAGSTIWINTTTPGAVIVDPAGAAYNFNAPLWQNYTTNVSVDAVGTQITNPLLGIPYNLTVSWVPDWTVTPIVGVNEIPGGTVFNVNATVYDFYGNIAPGYYGQIDVQTNETNTLSTIWTQAVTGPIVQVLDGLGGTTSPFGGGDGYYNNTAQLYNVGIWVIWANDTTAPIDSLTPAGAPFQQAFNETDNTHVRIIGGGFFWTLVTGWNVVSVPMNTSVAYGATFTASEAAAAITTAAGVYGVALPVLTISNRLAGDPAAYESFDGVTMTGVDFIMNIDDAYWVWVDNAITAVYVQSDELGIDDPDMGITAGVNTVTLDAGWNMVNTGLNATSGQFDDGALGTAANFVDPAGNQGWRASGSIFYSGGGEIDSTYFGWYDQPIGANHQADAQDTNPPASGFGYVQTAASVLTAANTWDPALQQYETGCSYDDWFGLWNFGSGYNNEGKAIYWASGFFVYSSGGGDITYNINTL